MAGTLVELAVVVLLDVAPPLLPLLVVAGFGAVFVGTTNPAESVFTTGFGGVNGEASGGPYTFAFFLMSSGRSLLISVSRGVGGMILIEGLL